MISKRCTTAVLCGLSLLAAVPGAVADTGVVEIYSAPDAHEVRERVTAWVSARDGMDDERLQQIGALWGLAGETPSARDLLDRVVESFALADPATREFVGQCVLVDAPLFPPDVEALVAAEPDAFYVQNMRLYHARHLVQRKLYDEALVALAEVDVREVVDPATALFFKAICEHQLLMKEEGLRTLSDLLENTEHVPASYASIAQLMQYELQNLEEETLDEVARLMADVERRLDLGRGGQKVQRKEDQIVAKLDKIIEKLEQQMGGGGGGGANQNNSNRSSAPAGDSSVKGATAPGEADKKDYEEEGAWGDLPPKEEARVKQMIGKNFPPHYQQLIEEVTRKNATRRATRRGGE